MNVTMTDEWYAFLKCLSELSMFRHRAVIGIDGSICLLQLTLS